MENKRSSIESNNKEIDVIIYLCMAPTIIDVNRTQMQGVENLSIIIFNR
jgi:hypothetical protein